MPAVPLSWSNRGRWGRNAGSRVWGGWLACLACLVSRDVADVFSCCFMWQSRRRRRRRRPRRREAETEKHVVFHRPKQVKVHAANPVIHLCPTNMSTPLMSRNKLEKQKAQHKVEIQIAKHQVEIQITKETIEKQIVEDLFVPWSSSPLRNHISARPSQHLPLPAWLRRNLRSAEVAYINVPTKIN